MRISSQLRAISLGSAIVLLVLAPILIWFFAEFSIAKTNGALVYKINENFFERVALRDQYFLYREPRAIEQWNANIEQAHQLIRQANDQFSQEDQQHLLKRLAIQIDGSAIIFKRIIENTGKLSTNTANQAVYEEFDKRLFSQLLLKSVSFRDDLTSLLINVQQRVEQTYRYLAGYVLFLLVTLTAVTMLSSIHIGRLVRKRLLPLHEGAKLIADGDFGHQIPSDGSDEFAELTVAINVMTNKLRSANKELALEVVERMTTENELLAMTSNLKKAQQDLIGREKFTNAVFEFTPEALFLVDATGVVVRANKAALNIFEYTIEEMQGINVEQLMPARFRHEHPEMRIGLTKNIVERLQGIDKELVGLRANGDEFPAKTTLSPLVFGMEHYVIVSLTDLSNSKAANVALARYAAIVESTDDAIISKTLTGIITSWNRAAEKMFGYSSADMVGKSIDLLLLDHQQTEEKMIIERVGQGTWIKNFETVRRRKDGSLIDISATISPLYDASGTIVGASKVARDITERKQIEAALVQSTTLLQIEQRALKDARDRIALATNSGGIGIWDWDLVSGQFTCDEWQYRLFGLAHPGYLEELKIWLTRLHPDDQLRIGNELGNAIAGGKTYDTEFRCIWPDGSVHHIRATGQVTRDANGQPLRMVGANWDVTESRQLTAELVLARDAAQSANTTKSQFLANMSHEIRTPMNAILGMLQLLQHTELTTRQLDYAVKTQSAAQSLLGILNDILDLSKVEADKLKIEQLPFQVDVLMRELSVVLASSVGSKDVEVLFYIDPTLPACLIGDAMRLRQVLINLAGNAIKFTQRGEVVLSLNCISQQSDQIEIEFSVRDSGIGIAAEQLPTIFDAFIQAEASTTRHFGGTGLGLAISHRLVALMGGSLTVQSTVGVGSCFQFRLTLAQGTELAATALSVQQWDNQPQQVLIIDDNASAREVLQAMIESLGWQADTAASGEIALAMLTATAASPFPYDVVFVDWKMPQMDGWETTRQIRQLQYGERAPVIVMVTAHGREILAKRLQTERDLLNGFLIKPVTASMLLEAVIDTYSAPLRVIAMAAAKRLAGLRLLVVEDTPLNQQVARELLANEGAEVIVANDGYSGVEMVLGGIQPFDAVLMDIQMPGMDGYVATEKIRQDPRMQALPIIAMTANAMATDKEACRLAGMNDHVAKPIDLDEVVATILHHCAQRKALQIHAGATVTALFTEIELDKALQRLGRNKPLFISLAQRFESDVTPMLVNFRHALSDGDYLAAAAVMHTLKGISGTVGSVYLAAYSARLEVQLKTAGAVIDSDAICHELESLVTQIVAALKTIVVNLCPTAIAPQPKSVSTEAINAVDISALRSALEELDTLLQKSNMLALNKFEELEKNYCHELGEQLAPLAYAIDRLDFKLALESSQQLQRGLQV